MKSEQMKAVMVMLIIDGFYRFICHDLTTSSTIILFRCAARLPFTARQVQSGRFRLGEKHGHHTSDSNIKCLRFGSGIMGVSRTSRQCRGALRRRNYRDRASPDIAVHHEAARQFKT